MFHRCRHTEEEIIECMAMLGDRSSLAAIHSIIGYIFSISRIFASRVQ